MEQTISTTPKLFVTSIVENKDEFEEKYERSFNTLQSLISGLSEKEAQNALNNAVCKDKNHEEVSLGLLFVILTEPQSAAKSYRDLTLITRDGLTLVLSHLTQLILDRYLRLTDTVRTQVLWLVREMIRNAVTNVDNLCWNLMRHAAGGDVSSRNIMLIEALLDIYQENRTWLDKFPVLIASVVYAYLRLIEDHAVPALAPLRHKEVVFVVTLIRERFADCLVIGRDFVRLLQNVARIPEFDQLWRDLLTNPKSLCPTFTGILQLLQTRTSRRFLQSRLTPDMERKLVFLTSQVRFGYHKRYQEWFQRQYLATPESQSLRCDLIRFIVGVIHPTNELLCSDIIPRWAVIGWLLTTCTSSVAASNAKLALFYDWLFFEADKDNIMNIEPAILVMHHSMRSHPAVTATLLDFLCRIIPNFYPLLADKVRAGIFSSLRQILEKRVLPTLFPLFDNPKLDRELRTMVREAFKEFCLPPTTEGKEDFNSAVHLNTKEEPIEQMLDGQENHTPSNNHVGDSEPTFSDDEEEAAIPATNPIPRSTEDDDDDDDIPLAKVRLKEKPTVSEGKLQESELYIVQQLDGEIRVAVETLHLERDNEAKCQAMERLVQLVIQEEDMDAEVISLLGSCLCTVLKEQLEGKVFPVEVNDETLEDSIGRPLFVMFRNVVQLPEDDLRRHPILSVLAEMSSHQPRVGYLLLYFLKACKLNDGKSSAYSEFCQVLDKELESCLLSDLKLCQEDDVNLFCWLVPEVYIQFPSVAIGHAQLLHLVVSTVDAAQLQDFVCHILQGRLVMFRSDSFRALLSASLSWETFEQYCLWQLVTAHGIPIDYVLPILPRLEFSSHAEALTSILLMLKQERPTAELLKHLLSREVRPPQDVFVVSTLKYWCQEHEEKLGELMANLLSSRYPNTSPNKRKRGGGGANRAGLGAGAGPPSAEQVLGHLDQLRQCCRQNNFHLYSLDSMQRALQQAQSLCTDIQRKKFSDLFALAEVDEVEAATPKPSGGSKVSAAGRGRKGVSSNSSSGGTKGATTSKSRAATKEVSDSSEESSEEEEIVKPRHSKKRKKVNPVGSDSD
ncbi:integrator complex subunit 3 isoform X2 [Zootermopsis nevadensis]|uniref:integrator complex subunit 3 isoform X2 n=1 Tax=Zootermopsis nevadensis TaxID=136037 RepID=UPI000B8E5114|nr:integrator complex subunit 3 isoform X2 [Zootermopsis nevadensis]